MKMLLFQRDHAYSISEQTDIAEHVLSVLGIHEFHILAHDYGDTVAQEFLAREYVPNSGQYTDYQDDVPSPKRIKSGFSSLVILV